MIEYLELTDFRNFQRREFRFSSSDLVLTGPNGSGKTSVLEALGYLSILRSFRGAGTKELVRIGEKSFTLKCRLAENGAKNTLRVSEDLSGRRELWISGEKPGRSSDFIREFRTVAFVPEDREIVSGASGRRRRFFDMLISSVDSLDLRALSEYMRALAQRNRALKGSRPETAALFDTELASRAPEICAKRRKYAALLSEQVRELLGPSGVSFEIRFLCDSSMDCGENLQQLKKNFPRERQRGCTLSGPQLDEFEFRYDGKIMRNFSSTGQKGLIALLLKLAEFDIVRRESSEPVAVLADDVLGDLDRNNAELFLSVVKKADQRFFTFAEMPSFGGFDKFETVTLP